MLATNVRVTTIATATTPFSHSSFPVGTLFSTPLLSWGPVFWPCPIPHQMVLCSSHHLGVGSPSYNTNPISPPLFSATEAGFKGTGRQVQERQAALAQLIRERLPSPWPQRKSLQRLEHPEEDKQESDKPLRPGTKPALRCPDSLIEFLLSADKFKLVFLTFTLKCWKICPSPKSKHDFIVAEVSIIVDRQYGLCFNLIPGQESIVQTVLLSTDNLKMKEENTRNEHYIKEFSKSL